MRCAANSRASRCAGGSVESASTAVAAPTSSAAADAGFQRSKRSVYSTRAASPRVRTASRISVVARSTPSSCAASKASSRANDFSKPGSAVERRSGRMARLAEGFDERRDRRTLELERRRIDDQPARDREDVLDGAQPVRLQGIARIDKVDDRVREPHERSELHRSVKANEVDV